MEDGAERREAYASLAQREHPAALFRGLSALVAVPARDGDTIQKYVEGHIDGMAYDLFLAAHDPQKLAVLQRMASFSKRA